VYSVAGEPLVVNEDGSTRVSVHHGEVRALILYHEEDAAAVCDMEEVDAEKNFPLAERECTRLKWAVPASESEDWSLTMVPLSHVRRIIQVAPDFAELSTHKGVKALPARYTASLDKR